MRKSVRMSLSFACGVLLALMPLAIENLQHKFGYNAHVGLVGDALWMPGQLVARLFLPEGIHTGSGSAAFVPVSLMVNCAVFTAVTYLLIRLATSKKETSL